MGVIIKWGGVFVGIHIFLVILKFHLDFKILILKKRKETYTKKIFITYTLDYNHIYYGNNYILIRNPKLFTYNYIKNYEVIFYKNKITKN